MNKFVIGIFWFISLVLAITLGYWFANNERQVILKTPAEIAEKIRKYDKYTYENLSLRQFTPSQIILGEVLKDDPEYTAYEFSFFDETKRVSGQINIPKSPEPVEGFPTVLMIRGYAEKESYRVGNGTRNAAAYFAQQGFLTVAPDFLGYGNSDAESTDELEQRFDKYVTVLTLLECIKNIKQANPDKLAFWAHSNGGHITMALLEISQRNIPATLWAPVTKPFPYSVLVYTDEDPDNGKRERKVIANFEEDYEASLYSIDTYLDRIQAPIQLHQGTADLLVRRDWSDQIVKKLKDKDKEVTYLVHPGADHNMVPAWNTAVEQDVAFFKKHFKD